MLTANGAAISRFQVLLRAGLSSVSAPRPSFGSACLTAALISSIRRNWCWSARFPERPPAVAFSLAIREGSTS